MAARRSQESFAKPPIKHTDVERLVDSGPRTRTELVALKVQVHFKVEANGAKTVSVAGTFNNWDPKGVPLNKIGDAWDTTISLPRGRYEYKFVVDGKWLPDPSARESVANPFGSRNSVLSV
jgi:1,4-alpha-glucan branching enzyme